MTLNEICSLLPPGNKTHKLIREHHIRRLRLVTTDQILENARNIQDLPIAIQIDVQNSRNFSGFNLPDQEAHFISMAGRLFPNPPHMERYPSLLDVSFSEAVGDDVHWFWFGGFRGVTLLESPHALSWLNPQTNYRVEEGGPFRRVATSTLLLGREWEPHAHVCPCGSSCLKPDHWRQRNLGRSGRGRVPNLNVRLTRSIKKDVDPQL